MDEKSSKLTNSAPPKSSSAESSIFAQIPPRVAKIEEKLEQTLKEAKETQKESDELYKKLQEDQEKTDHLVKLGFLVIILTAVGVAIALVSLTLQFFELQNGYSKQSHPCCFEYFKFVE